MVKLIESLSSRRPQAAPTLWLGRVVLGVHALVAEPGSRRRTSV
jgi:hypothetical protein